MRPLILDTNIVLDLLLFADRHAQGLGALLHPPAQAGIWLSTEAMRAELAHVLAYRHLQPRLALLGQSAQEVLARFDAAASLVPAADAAPVRCKDADDQKFIDLAVAHRAVLLSKDKAVLQLRKRLARLDVWVGNAQQFEAMRAQEVQEVQEVQGAHEAQAAQQGIGA